MSNERNEKAAAGQAAGQGKAPAKFTREQLELDCLKLFSVTRSTFVAATAHMKEPATLEEYQKEIKGWLDKPVTPKKKEGK